MKIVLALVTATVLAVMVLAMRRPWICLAIGLVLLATGEAFGLLWTPPEKFMNEVVRIKYVHVPAAWLCMVTYTAAFIAALGSLFASDESKPWPRMQWDALLEATVEVGAVLNVLLLATGSIWARMTWGWWWAWNEPRLTSSAVMLLSFLAVAILRSLVEDLDKRALWSAVATILASMSPVIVYFSVWLFPSLHQTDSTPATVDDDMKLALRLCAFAYLFIAAWMVAVRLRIAQRRAMAAAPPPLPGDPQQEARSS